MTTNDLTFLLATAIAAGTPILYAALGEILTERAGILNLGLEGLMLIGAVSGFAAASWMGNPWAGVLAALLAGALAGFLFGVLCIFFRTNQIVTGLALTIFGIGLSGFLGKPLLGKPLEESFAAWNIPVLSDIPFIGRIFFQHDIMVYICYLLVPVLWYTIYRTQMGLHLRTVGENPRAADTLGINVSKTRYLYTTLGGAITALGGAYLSIAYVPTWLEGMTAGRGWIALAVVIFSGWNPLVAAIGAYLFGGVASLSLLMQTIGTKIPTHFLGMAPYALTILVLILATRGRRGGGGPAALGVPYDSEEK
jgi:general nucleoside transport system permease protein